MLKSGLDLRLKASRVSSERREQNELSVLRGPAAIDQLRSPILVMYNTSVHRMLVRFSDADTQTCRSTSSVFGKHHPRARLTPKHANDRGSPLFKIHFLDSLLEAALSISLSVAGTSPVYCLGSYLVQ